MQIDQKSTAYIKPLNILLDLIIISVPFFIVFNGLLDNVLQFWVYQVACWCIIAYFSGYYEVYRFTGSSQVVYKTALQAIIFSITTAAFLLFTKHVTFNAQSLARYLAVVLAAITALKIVFYAILKSLPVKSPENFIVLGGDSALRLWPQTAPLKVFTPQQQDAQSAINSALAFAAQNKVNTIYCSLAAVTPSQIHALKAYTAATGTTLKFIPDTALWPSKSYKIDYFEEQPFLYLQKTPLNNPVLRIMKRLFDIVFSLLVIIFVLSWLTPIIALLIKLESKGPAFFMQIRLGENGTEFWCYKFRSMKVNNSEGKVTVKNDPRITRVGAFLRKSSLDEMPQFFNVLLGHMSVVGPRPKIWSHHNQYKDHIHKFMDRLNVKPGITGLAQVSGYRGEINSDAEMQNRIRYDVFYNENWSLLLDIRIIIQTVVNIFMGEEKAF